jgi:uncharacterized membrane protein YbhN (UPF0104 family)
MHSLRPWQLVRRALVAVALLVALVTVVFAVPSLDGVRDEIGRIGAGWIVAALASELLSCIAFVVLFRAFFNRIPGALARRVAWIEMGSGALLPGGGVTSYALGGLLLHRAGMTPARIIRRSGGLFWLTTALNAVAIVIGALLLLLLPGGRHDFTRAVLPLVVVVPLIVVIAAAPWLARGTRHRSVSAVVGGVADAWRSVREPSWRLLGALGYLGFDIAVLELLLQALGVRLEVGGLLLAYLIGYLAATVPVPGGIGVLEGGLVATLVAYGAPASKAAAAVIVYHAIAFWIPSLGGVIGLVALRLSSRLEHGATEAQGGAVADGTAAMS